MPDHAAGKPGRREIFAWCLYDFANSAFTTIIVTFAFSLYFARIVVGPGGETAWGRTYAVSMLLSALLSPLIGAAADEAGAKRRLLIATTLVSVIGTGFLAWVGPGEMWKGAAIFVLANTAYGIAIAVYDAFLVEIAPENTGRVSGYGWALGYAGGLLSLILAAPFLTASDPAFRATFIGTAGFYLLFSLPVFAWLRERRPRLGLHLAQWRGALRRLRHTARDVRHYARLWRYLLAYWIYNDGINTIVVFASIFAAGVLGFGVRDLVLFFLAMQITAAAGAWLFGWLADRIGARRVIAQTLWLLVGVTLAASLVRGAVDFYAVGFAAGFAMGGNQAVSRAYLVQLVPVEKSAEFFGFFSLTGKFAAILGPLIYGEMAGITGSQRWAVLTVSAFFLAGLALLRGVRP